MNNKEIQLKLSAFSEPKTEKCEHCKKLVSKQPDTKYYRQKIGTKDEFWRLFCQDCRLHIIKKFE